MPLRSTTVLPTGVISVQVGIAQTLELLGEYPDKDDLLVALVIAPGDPDDPINPKELSKIAVMARLSVRLNLPGGSVQVTVEGLARDRVVEVRAEQGLLVAKVDEA